MVLEDFSEQHALPRLRRLPSWVFSKLALRGTRITTRSRTTSCARRTFAGGQPPATEAAGMAASSKVTRRPEWGMEALLR